MANYSIKDIEHLSGIKAHTIRIWEKRYNILEPRRTETNIRFYNDEDLKKILNISVLNRYGYKISKIAQLSEDRIGKETLHVTQSSRTPGSQIEQLIIAMVDFDEKQFTKVLNNAVLNYSFEKMMVDVIYAFFEKIGILWQTGNINPAQEHFVSNLIRQKLIVAIDNLVDYSVHDAKTFVLFLPDGEWHELGLLFYTYFIKKIGHRVTYLGSSLPMEDVLNLDQHIQFEYLVTSVKSKLSNHDYNSYLNDISKAFPLKNIILLGVDTKKVNLKSRSNILLPQSRSEFQEYLENI